jgi:type IV pilus assembly protein PilA
MGRRNSEHGFTLIEILVVLLIITVLSAIALPLFINQRSKAQDSEAKTAARTALGAMEVFHHDNNTFAGATVSGLVKIEPALAGARGLDVVVTGEDFTIKVDSASGGEFSIERRGTSTDRLCGAPDEGGCPQSGRW